MRRWLNRIKPVICRGFAQARVPSSDGVTVVDSVQQAQRIVDILLQLPKTTYHAWDTEVIEIDINNESAVGHGKVICASFFCGPDVNFGNGPRVWIDNIDDSKGVLHAFRPVLESVQMKKVWHNYSFDRHVLYNHGINVQGLGGDTMHMARLWNTGRDRQGGYGLEALTGELLSKRKIPMKELFATPKLKKDGTPGREKVLPPLDQIQCDPATRGAWISYSTYDAESTWHLRCTLEEQLKARYWVSGRTMWDFYQTYFVPFAECLTDMEREGIMVDVKNHLPQAEKLALQERAQAEKTFLRWAEKMCPDGGKMNVASDVQKAHFLFAPVQRSKPNASPASLKAAQAAAYKKSQKASQVSMSPEEDDPFSEPKPARKPSAAMSDSSSEGSDNHWPAERVFKIDNTEQYIEPGKKAPKKQREMVLKGLGLEPVAWTEGGWPAVSAKVLKVLAGKVDGPNPEYGLAYEKLGGGQAGKEACEAIHALYSISTIDTMLSNFILPLQQMADANSRVHCSLNLNTETGRLSARNPNLQNQPALEKDRYGIRKAFMRKPGHKLIVADYGQLELRLLAHMSKCKSMIEAFAAGGDFHSRTAMGMYPYIAEAVKKGTVLLEWDDAKGPPPSPLLKNVYANERRKAKVLNFSIAYGKTAMGLSRDWKVPLKEARETLAKWYADRPEVKLWQQQVLQSVRQSKATRTLLGRYRDLPDITNPNFRLRGHAERAAINTPIQGGAADVVMVAMLKLWRNQKLRDLGWKMLLQIHDEVILEGPADTAEAALKEVVQDMEDPFGQPLLVALVADAKTVHSWHDAK